MVKYRGIEICIISQFDVCRLPEFRYPSSPQPEDPFQVDGKTHSPSSTAYPTASCHVPIYPGSQIWFEYAIDGPHPPEAAYFFKLSINGKAITAWDCTARHGFHGKMMYNLLNEGPDPVTGEGLVRRQALRFGDGIENRDRELDDDLIQINVYRIEHRKRIRDLQLGLGAVAINTTSAEGLRLTNSGLLEPGFRPRRYKYQLLDPVDMPYAGFRFYCRPYEYLEKHGLVHRSLSTMSSSSTSSTASQETANNSRNASPARQVVKTAESSIVNCGGANKSPVKNGDAHTPQSKNKGNIRIVKSESSTSGQLASPDSCLSIKTKDSIEELPSSVPRSPRSPRSPKRESGDESDKIEPEMPLSPTKSPRDARRRLKKKLTVKIDGADFDIERKKRPLSPFTSGGVLRKAVPQTAPATVTEFGPTVEEEVRASINTNKSEAVIKPDKIIEKTTSTERGGKRLMGFLGRRIGSDKTN
ncbi:hypothetical protein LTR96_000366 [Exophiala xenobiotica]|uniref:Uncharacterized protein n=1 Tax=Vermiconidia calcicola TaxID=1690605 RepID=A0AAV9Q906_9PEZI|nr:hypothetical protein H2202_007652 [Exophiala xenobiotica]KAK5535365.1 hypothetical protein LTR25_006373 [Vermiconidia calcicola]KAK5546866.1 hypothetical protein LTR23_003237 [Chaetothyriales sp. CCFEE 6169]KAK5273766.1 hypothetical protein LTR96_000366 [Exophiala xenobiotica]KAK5373744.1 hypothetical protein LTS13_005943 [Exophiala xenobiotica]